jgi:hypothetical protein
VFARPDSVLRILENFDWTLGGRLASCGAIKGGRLKEANMVRESRMANKAYDSLGIVAPGDEEGAPNIFANCESLYTQILMLTEEVAMNFVLPEVTADAFLDETVDDIVSTVFAVAYVEK